MSLRVRVVALIGLVLLFSTVLGALVAGYETRQALDSELQAGLTGAVQTVRSAFEDLPNSDHPQRDLRQLVDTFNGDRHVRAMLLGDDGRPKHTSLTVASGPLAPAWFARVLGPPPPPVVVPTPLKVAGFSAIALRPTADLDLAGAWRQFSGVILVLTITAAVGLALAYTVIGAAFRPLRALATQFERIGGGDYSGRVEERGPSELLILDRGFNRMAAELAASTERNRLLNDQMLTLQDEERADIARDLHDEFGPHLFAVNMEAEMIVRLAGKGEGAIVDQARAIQDGVGHMQRQVRDLLGRLRPTRVTEFGLNAALVDLVAFWRARRPEVVIGFLAPDDESLVPETMKEVVYRVVQESVNNAVRHGDPRSVEIKVVLEGESLQVSVVNDGAAKSSPSGVGGLGLIGMRERVAAVGGVLKYGPREGALGWATEARLDLAGGAGTTT